MTSNTSDHAPGGTHPGEHGQHTGQMAEHDAHSEHGGAHAGHGADHVTQFRRLFWINLIIAVPVVAFSSMFAMLVGYQLPDFPGAAFIAPALGTVMYVWGGRPLQVVAVGLLDDHLKHCVLNAARAGGDEADIKIKEATDAIARLVRS